MELTVILPCFLCGRESDMNVIVDGKSEPLCSVCYEKADPDEEGDTEDEGGYDGNLEGDPAFNGAFNAW